jgi:GMP synthase-like glutamine amidotransferase
MRIGILRTDAVLERFQARHGDYPEMFERILGAPGHQPPALGADRPEFMTYAAYEGELPAPDACGVYVITGSRHSVYDDVPWLPALVAFLRDVLAGGGKLVGICFGHQLMAHHFGGATAPAAGGWSVGVQQAAVIRPQPWMQPAASGFGLLASHRDQVVRLPPGAVGFAAGTRCPHAGFVMGNQVLTFQGHPEFSKAYAADLMRMRRELLGEETFREGMASLERESDAALVARWILNFAWARE